MKRIYLRLICSLLCVILCISSAVFANATTAEENSGTRKISQDVPFVMYEDEQGYRFLGPTGDLCAENKCTDHSESEKATKSKGFFRKTQKFTKN